MDWKPSEYTRKMNDKNLLKRDRGQYKNSQSNKISLTDAGDNRKQVHSSRSASTNFLNFQAKEYKGKYIIKE